MNLDVNKIIMESLTEASGDGSLLIMTPEEQAEINAKKTELVDRKDEANKLIKRLGTPFEKPKPFSIADDVKETVKAAEAAKAAKQAAEIAKKTSVSDDANALVSKIGRKGNEFIRNNFTLDPAEMDYGKTGLAAAGIAAGLGALALRKRMKNANR